MKSMSKALIAATLIAMPVAAHGDEELAPPVAFRHNSMQVVVNAGMGAMAVLKGQAGSDADLVPLAEAMAAGARVSAAAFKADTRSLGAHGNAKAKDKIWEDWADFSSKMDAFVADTDALVAAARTGDKAATGAALGKAFKNCKGCHDTYKSQ